MTLNQYFDDKKVMSHESSFGSRERYHMRYWGRMLLHRRAVLSFLNYATGGEVPALSV
jgi:hypothetical protein